MSCLRKLRIILFLGLFVTVGCTGKSSTDKALEYVERSTSYINQGQYRAALIEIRNAIQSDPENIKYISKYADILIEIGNPNQAEELLKTRPDQIEHVRLQLAESMLLQGKFISAKSLLNDWKYNAVESEEYERLTALQLFLAGNRSEAIARLRQQSEKPESTQRTTLELVRLLIQNEQLTEADQRAEALLSKYPNDPDILYLSAQVSYLKGDLNSAEEKLTDSLKYLPNSDILLHPKLKVLELLSTVLTDSGKPAEALIYTKLIREANPDAFLAQQQYKDALNAASQGDLLSAKAAFEDILTQFPNNQQAALLLGLINLEEGNIVDGESLLSGNLDVETAPTSLIQATALAQAELNKPDQALRVLEKALLARPDDVSLLTLYGVISLNNNDDRVGLQTLSKAIELDPSRTRLRLLLAQYYRENNNADIALGHLRKAYRQDIADWPTTGFYISLLISENLTDEAQQVRNNIIDKYQSNPSAQWIVTMADYRLGNTQSALDGLAQLHIQEPDNVDVIIALARLYQQLGSYNNAASMWLKAIAINPTNPELMNNLIRSKSQISEFTELVSWLKNEANKNKEVALPLNSLLVELLVNEKDISQAQSIALAYQKNSHPMARAMQANVLRGEAYLEAEKGNWATSLAKVDNALEYVPNNAKLTILASQIERQMGDVEAAIKRLDALLALQTTNPSLHVERANIYLQQDGKEQALNYLKGIWHERPNTTLATVYFPLIADLEPESLESVYRQLQQAEPKNSNVITRIAGLYLTRGKVDNAISEYNNAIAINPKNVTALNNLAWLIRESHPEDALKHAQLAAELAPNTASVLDTYGWLLHLNGQNKKAIEVLERAISIDDSSEEIKQHLKEVKG